MRVYTFEQIYQLVWKDYSVGDIKNIIWCLVKRLRKKLNVVEDGAGNCIVSVRDIGYKFELNNEKRTAVRRIIRKKIVRLILFVLERR